MTLSMRSSSQWRDTEQRGPSSWYVALTTLHGSKCLGSRAHQNIGRSIDRGFYSSRAGTREARRRPQDRNELQVWNRQEIRHNHCFEQSMTLDAVKPHSNTTASP